MLNTRVHWLVIALIGAGVGFAGGLFGKGGSAIATPLLAAAGVPAIVAVASPLPATIPATMLAYGRYRRVGAVDDNVARLSIIVGVPATVLGALSTKWISPGSLITMTDLVVVGIGVKLLTTTGPTDGARGTAPSRARVGVIAGVVGLLGGLLANAGGFLLAPLYVAVLKLPLKIALAASLVVAATLAVPGTLVHAALGHVDWTVTAVFAMASIPCSAAGAQVALDSDPRVLQRVFGSALIVMGAIFLVIG